jgi:hypothetical protein
VTPYDNHLRITKIVTDVIPFGFFFFFLDSWGGMRLSPLGMSATDWPIVPAPDDR